MTSEMPKAGSSSSSLPDSKQPKDVQSLSTKRMKLKSFTYPSDKKPYDILGMLHEKRKNGEFCDVQLKLSSSKTVYAHKALLAACSAYFESMFSGSFLEATSDVVDLSQTAENSDVLENVIDTFYGRKFRIDISNVQETINLATMFLIDDLKEECTRVLNEILDVDNAACLLTVAIEFDLKDLQQKLKPILESRFHDCIMFQDDLYVLNSEGFEFLHDNILTKYISRKSEYITFILKWFCISENDDRAQQLIKAIDKVNFKISKHVYVGFRDILEDVLKHLEDVNSDLSDKMKYALRKSLHKLKPVNIIDQKLHANDIKQNYDSDDDEDDVSKEAYDHAQFEKQFKKGKIQMLGPKRKEEYTSDDEKIWNQAHQDMAERDQHRIWAAEWPLDLTNSLGTHDNPKRPKNIKREAPPDIVKSRKFRKKTPEEIAEETRLVDAVIVLSPCSYYLEKLCSNASQSLDFDYDMLDVCAYVPRKRAWYKIASVSASGIQKMFGLSGKGHQNPEKSDGNEQQDDEDNEPEDMAAMMATYAPDMPPDVMMMMMHDFPPSRRRRMMEDIMHPGMMRRMMEMRMDEEEDMPRSMMRELSRRHRHKMPLSNSRKSIPSLKDAKWKVVYLQQKLFFYHQDFSESVFCYDILSQKWQKSGFHALAGNYERSGIQIVNSINLIVLGQILYAFIHIIEFERHREHYKSKKELEDESKTQHVRYFYKVFKMTETNDGKENVKWVHVVMSDINYAYIAVDEQYRSSEKEREMEFYPFGSFPKLRQPNCLKTFLFAEDDEKVNIFTMTRKPPEEYRKLTKEYFVITGVDVVYLDIPDREHLLYPPDHSMFLREPTPLYTDDLAVLINDDLRQNILIKLGEPGVSRPQYPIGKTEPEKKSEFLEALQQYPLCPSLTVNNGRSMWILRGSDNNISELTEIWAVGCYQTPDFVIKSSHHPPPPFRYFTMATTAKMDSNVIRTFTPTKYLHESSNF